MMFKEGRKNPVRNNFRGLKGSQSIVNYEIDYSGFVLKPF
jgi:hypothetical protein